MYVYRVEDQFGYGYKGCRTDMDYPSLDSLSQCHENVQTSSWGCDARRVLPWHDNIPKSFLKREGWYFAFHTKDQITRYFTEYDLYLMGQLGGVVVTLEVDDHNVWKGNNQCVFYKARSKVIKKERCSVYSSIDTLSDWVDYEELEESYIDLKEYKEMMG